MKVKGCLSLFYQQTYIEIIKLIDDYTIVMQFTSIIEFSYKMQCDSNVLNLSFDIVDCAILVSIIFDATKMLCSSFQAAYNEKQSMTAQ